MSKTLVITAPGEIDGTPAEVRRAVLDQLEAMVHEVDELLADSIKQLRNAGATEALEQGAQSGLRAIYELRRPKEARLLEPLRRQHGQFYQNVRVLNRASREYDNDPDAGVL